MSSGRSEMDCTPSSPRLRTLPLAWSSSPPQSFGGSASSPHVLPGGHWLKTLRRARKRALRSLLQRRFISGLTRRPPGGRMWFYLAPRTAFGKGGGRGITTHTYSARISTVLVRYDTYYVKHGRNRWRGCRSVLLELVPRLLHSLHGQERKVAVSSQRQG